MEVVEPNRSELFDSFTKDPFELEFFSNEPEKVKKVPNNDSILENDFLVPTIPFSIVPGHHGGTTSSMSLFKLTSGYR